MIRFELGGIFTKDSSFSVEKVASFRYVNLFVACW